MRDVREAIAEKRIMSLQQLFAACKSVTAAEKGQADVFYPEAFSFVHFLDSSENPTRQQKFRVFLRDISHMRGFHGPTRIMNRFHDDFGDTATLEREWLAWVGKSSPALSEVRIFNHLEGVAQSAIAAHPSEIGPGSRIDAEVVLGHPGAQGIEVIFGHRSAQEFYIALFVRDGRTSLEQLSSGKTRPLAHSRALAGVNLSGKHRIAVDVAAGDVTMRIDGAEALRYLTSAPISGRWGIAVYDDGLSFADGQVTPIPPPPESAMDPPPH
jgi:hypothetical protein